jgi:hypothetical protein
MKCVVLLVLKGLEGLGVLVLQVLGCQRCLVQKVLVQKVRRLLQRDRLPRRDRLPLRERWHLQPEAPAAP